MFIAGEAVGGRQGQEDEKTKNNIFKSSAAAVESAVSKDAVPGFARKGRISRQFRFNANAGQWDLSKDGFTSNLMQFLAQTNI